MTLVICNAPSISATMTVNNQDDYIKACKMIDSCIARNISLAIATNNQTIANWLVTQYENQCKVIFEDETTKSNLIIKTSQTNTVDFDAGKRDKQAGYYDKWYRYNRKDAGQAYDEGFKSIEFTKEITIIECK